MANSTDIRNKGLGRCGEDVAAAHLEGLGYKIVARNVRYKVGEIDIVASRGRELHFIEVKARERDSAVPPLEAITASKMRRTRRAAEAYLSDWRIFRIADEPPPCHFDVVAVEYVGGNPVIECIFDAF